MNQSVQHALEELFQKQFSEPARTCVPIKPHASSRLLFRLQSDARSVVAVHCEQVAENRAFIAFSRHFRSCNLPVPEIFCVSNDETMYLQTDLGNETLYDLLHKERDQAGNVSPRVQELYAETVRLLSYFQIEAGRDLDYSYCYESLYYDKSAMLFDCNRFRDELVARMGIAYANDALTRDFEALTDFLAKADMSYFLYRDFQGRNVMIREGAPYFIDYQSGRHGALQYDLASLLYQSQARLPGEMRDRLIDTYLAQLSLRLKINRDQFIEFFDGFVLIRLIQVLGAYGRLGLGENRAYFLQGIPFAVTTFLDVLGRQRLPIQFSELTSVFARLTQQLETAD